MGQRICAIITGKKVGLPKDVVHFLEKDAVVIPLDLDLSNIRLFVDGAGEFDDIIEYIGHLKGIPQDENDQDYKNNLPDLLALIESHKLRNFIFEYYSEWADVPDEILFMAVIDGKIKKDSIYQSGTSANPKNKAYYDLVGCESSWYATEERYFCYDDSVAAYVKKG